MPFLQARMKKYIKKPQKHKHAADENANSSLEIRQLLYGPLQDGKKESIKTAQTHYHNSHPDSEHWKKIKQGKNIIIIPHNHPSQHHTTVDVISPSRCASYFVAAVASSAPERQPAKRAAAAAAPRALDASLPAPTSGRSFPNPVRTAVQSAADTERAVHTGPCIVVPFLVAGEGVAAGTAADIAGSC